MLQIYVYRLRFLALGLFVTGSLATATKQQCFGIKTNFGLFCPQQYIVTTHQ